VWFWLNGPVTNREIAQSWGRVTDWLAANAPASHATLRPPATAADIASCEAALEMALPEELRQLLLLTDGAADFDADGTNLPGCRFMPGGHRLLSAAEIASGTQSLRKILDDLDEDLMVGIWWHPEWVLFARHVAADGLAVDQREGTGQGAVGEFMHEDETAFTMAPSIGEFLGMVADSLAAATDFQHYRPFVKSGRLDWNVVQY
jgi:cell wall assembly regulator SMI1